MLFAIQKTPPGPPVHPSFLLCCTSLCPHSLQETDVGPLESHSGICCIPLSSALTILESPKVSVRSFFLMRVRHALENLPGNSAADFESGSRAKGEKSLEVVNSSSSAVNTPLFTITQTSQINRFCWHGRPSLCLLHNF